MANLFRDTTLDPRQLFSRKRNQVLWNSILFYRGFTPEKFAYLTNVIITFLKSFFISAAFTVTEILKWVILTFVLFSKIISEWNGWAKLSNNITVLGYLKKIQSVISLLLQDLQPRNLVGWWLRLRDSYLASHMSLWSCGHVKLQDKIRTLCLHF